MVYLHTTIETKEDPQRVNVSSFEAMYSHAMAKYNMNCRDLRILDMKFNYRYVTRSTRIYAI